MLMPPLRPGDLVDVVAPASQCTRANLNRGVKALEAMGLRARVPRDLFAPSLLFSNTDAVRLKHLKAAFYAEDSKLVWCLRGGYGSLRLLPEMARWRRPQQPKLLLGFSDITSLHTFVHQQWGWPSLHGPMVERLGRELMGAPERREVKQILFGEREVEIFKGLRPLNSTARRGGVVRGEVCGGTVAVLQSGLGTPYALKPRGRILFLEDVEERPHKIDRMLTQFAQAGWFEQARAIVFGRFQLSEGADRRGLWRDVIPRFAAACKLPVFAGLPVGHDPKRQRTLSFGTRAELHLGRSGVLEVATGIAAAKD